MSNKKGVPEAIMMLELERDLFQPFLFIINTGKWKIIDQFVRDHLIPHFPIDWKLASDFDTYLGKKQINIFWAVWNKPLAFLYFEAYKLRRV